MADTEACEPLLTQYAETLTEVCLAPALARRSYRTDSIGSRRENFFQESVIFQLSALCPQQLWH